MTDQEAKDYVEGAFQALKSRGWFQETGLVPTGVTDQEIAEFEAETGRKVPTLLKAFLQSYQTNSLYNTQSGYFWGIVSGFDGYVRPYPLALPTSVEALRGYWHDFCGLADYFHVPPERCARYLPIGLWDSDYLMWDLSKPEDQVREDDWGKSWILVSLPHDEEWDESLWEEGLEDPCAPGFKTLLDWCFYGTLIPEFEEEYQVKVNYERMNDLDFLWHYDEDRWKEKP